MKVNTKHLGFLKFDDILHRDMKGRGVGETYLKRLKLVFKSRLHFWNLITASYPCAVAVVRYSATILNGTQLEITEALRCILHGALDPKSNIGRIYMKRSDGGRGLINLVDSLEGYRGGLWHTLLGEQ